MATTYPDAPDLIPPKKHGGHAKALLAKGITEESLLARREKVFQMRAVDRLSCDEISKILSVSVGTVYTDIKWITKFKIRGLIEKDKSIVVEQDKIYRALLDKWLPVALSGNSKDETAMYATDRIARILVDQAKLHGFHSSSYTKGEAKEIGQEIGLHVLESMRRLALGQRTVVEAEIITQPAIKDVES